MCHLANDAFLGNGFARRPSLRNPLGLPPTRQRLIQWLFGLGGTKNSATTFFKPGKYKICTLNYEINAQWRCCLGDTRNGSDKWFVICPKLKCSTFAKMAEMFYGCMGS
jgi:hypothetical protein